jgi:hypothetical protein
MTRLPLLVMAACLAGCAAHTYTIEAASVTDANARAQRYCRLQNATAQFTGVQQQGSTPVEVYRCVPGSNLPLQPLTDTL